MSVKKLLSIATMAFALATTGSSALAQEQHHPEGSHGNGPTISPETAKNINMCDNLAIGFTMHPGLTLIFKGHSAFPDYDSTDFGNALKQQCNMSDETWNDMKPLPAMQKFLNKAPKDTLKAAAASAVDVVHKNIYSIPSYEKAFHGNEALHNGFHDAMEFFQKPKTPAPQPQ